MLPTILILVCWLIAAVAFVGLGALVLQSMGSTFRLSDAFWSGVGVAVIVVEWVHFFWPIDRSVTLAILFVGLSAIIVHRKTITTKLVTIVCEGWLPIFLMSLATIFIAWRSIGPCMHFDTGLYGALTVRWMHEFPLVPGIANLNSRMGFNSSVFPLISLFEIGRERGIALHLFNGLIVTAFCLPAIRAGVKIFAKKSASREEWFDAVLLPLAIFWMLRRAVVGADSDIAATAVCLAASRILFQWFARDASNNETERAQDVNRLHVAAFLCAIAITMKLSMIVFAGLLMFIAMVEILRFGSAVQRKLLIGTVGLIAVAIIPWFIRGAILSGYPLYPSTVFSIGGDWKVPQSLAEKESMWIVSWARRPFVSLEETRGFGWIGPWLERFLIGMQFTVPLVLIVAGLAIAGAKYRRKQPIDLAKYWPILAASFVGLIFWFFTAPEFRFGEAIIWTLAIVIAASQFPLTTWTRPIIAMLLLLAYESSAVDSLWRHEFQFIAGLKWFAPLEQPELKPFVTNSGLVIMQPTKNKQVGDAYLLASPDPDETIRLRRRNDITSGFAREK